MEAAEGRKKLTRGRQKIEIKLIENEEDRLITFSKRRSGIFKKASELSTLCGSELALVVISPTGKPFSFAHPTLEAVTGNVLNEKSVEPYDSINSIVEAKRRIRIDDLCKKYNELLDQLEAEKEREKHLKKMKDVRGKNHGWWEAPIDELDLDELQKMKESFTELYENVGFQLTGRDVTEVVPSSSSPSSSTINGGQEVNSFASYVVASVPDSCRVCSPPYL